MLLRCGEGEWPKLARLVHPEQIRVGPVTLDRRCVGYAGDGFQCVCSAVHSWSGSRDGENPLDRSAPVHQISLRRMRSRIWSLTRQAFAMIVSVGFLSAFDGNGAPSVMKRLATSQV